MGDSRYRTLLEWTLSSQFLEPHLALVGDNTNLCNYGESRNIAGCSRCGLANYLKEHKKPHILGTVQKLGSVRNCL